MKYFHNVISDALAHLRKTVLLAEQSNGQEFKSFIGTTLPSIIKIHPPEVANTKGSAKRLKRGSEEAMNRRKSEERNIDPQCNVEWPADWFIEEPRAIHQDCSMNSKFDLNMDCNIQQEIDVDDSFQMDDILGGDIEYESRSSDGSGSHFEDDFEWQQDGYTNVAELFPVPEEELDEAPATAVDKAAMVREARSKAAKAKASKTREMKLRAAAGTIDDTFVLSDSCSDDNKEIINPSDDDGVVLESEITTRNHKSRAKPLKERVYYDEMKENAHEQFQLELCFHNVTQLRKALDDYHIAYRRNFTYLKNNQDRVVVCCSSEGTCSFMIYSSEIEGESTHCIRQILLPHTCGTTTNTSREITPTYVERLEWEKTNARWCTNIVCSKKDLWQVTHIERTYEVNLAERTCGCFKWDLTGIPCKHAVAAIHKSKQFPEDYASDFFKKPMYKEAYKNFIYPVLGQHGWTKTDSPDIDPPEYKTKRGRKQKKRRRGQHESSKSTVQNRMTTIKCSNCKLQGHRYTNCATPLKPHLAARKAQHKIVRRLPDAAPPPASQHHAAPPTAPRHHAAPPSAPRRNAPSNSSHESTVTGRMPNANGSRLGVQSEGCSMLHLLDCAGIRDCLSQLHLLECAGICDCLSLNSSSAPASSPQTSLSTKSSEAMSLRGPAELNLLNCHYDYMRPIDVFGRASGPVCQPLELARGLVNGCELERTSPSSTCCTFLLSITSRGGLCVCAVRKEAYFAFSQIGIKDELSKLYRKCSGDRQVTSVLDLADGCSPQPPSPLSAVSGFTDPALPQRSHSWLGWMMGLLFLLLLAAVVHPTPCPDLMLMLAGRKPLAASCFAVLYPMQVHPALCQDPRLVLARQRYMAPPAGQPIRDRKPNLRVTGSPWVQ
ncbi:hypothetical protein D1007_56261 [Hordeum vulgare]|nr:hypothetical protein D1007_56261 [Hordeum vulgare]